MMSPLVYAPMPAFPSTDSRNSNVDRRVQGDLARVRMDQHRPGIVFDGYHLNAAVVRLTWYDTAWQAHSRTVTVAESGWFDPAAGRDNPKAARSDAGDLDTVRVDGHGATVLRPRGRDQRRHASPPSVHLAY
jgi:hypothetical protein